MKPIIVTTMEELEEALKLGKSIIFKGNVYFRGSKITDLGNLKEIRGTAWFRNSKITSLGKLESIGGNAWFEDSEITSLGKLESIGGNAWLPEDWKKKFPIFILNLLANNTKITYE